MATLTYIDKTKKLGAEVLAARDLVLQGFSEFYRLNGIRAQLIGTSQAAMKEGFGVNSNSEAQALSDRMAAFETHHESAAAINDLLDAMIDGSPPA